MAASEATRAAARWADWAACRSMIREGSHSFYAASLLLPERVRDPAFAIYAFCRSADDAVDSGARRAQAVGELRARLDAVYEGRPSRFPTDLAFAETVTRFAIPKALPAALLEGLAWDAEGRAYETVSEVYDYAARVASAVGAMMTLLMEVRAPEALARACDLGVAMQLTNIARDVGEDARMGRLYLPRLWVEEAGLDPDAFVAAPVFSPEIGAVTARLLRTAEFFYRRAAPGVAMLPRGCRPGIEAARLIYRDIGRVVAKNGYDSVSQRAFVPKQRKLALLAKAAATSLSSVPKAADVEGVLDEVGFLLKAVAASPSPGPIGRPPAFWNVAAQITQTVELFQSIERRERLERGAELP